MKNIFILFVAIFLISCNSNNQVVNKTDTLNNNLQHENKNIVKETIINKTAVVNTIDEKTIDFVTKPSAIIYKTKKDYNDKVPVIMNDEKTKIVSYPAIKDISVNGKLTTPDILNDGFLLDNRGISKNVVFLNITYTDYNKRTEVYSLNEMMNMIIDKEPITEMYNCGSRYQYKNIIAELNNYIDTKQLSKFKKIK